MTDQPTHQAEGRSAHNIQPRQGKNIFSFAHFPTILLVSLLFLPALNAADFASAAAFCASTVSTDTFQSPIAAAIFGLIILFAIAYMASQILEKPELSVWAKTEGITLAWSILLIGMVLSGFAFSCGLSNVLAAPPPSNNPFAPPVDTSPLAMASARLDSLSQDFGVALASDLAQSSIADQLDAVHYAYWSVPMMPNSGGLAYRANKRAWGQQKDLLIDLYLPLLVSVNVQKLLLDVLSVGIMGVLLPAALFLRLFFFSRDIGNLLIALSFAAFFALPLVYVFSFQATDAILPQLGGTAQNPFAGISSAQDQVVGDAFQRIGFLATQAILFPNLALVVMVTMTMACNKALKGFVP